jgi:hypothetical protein
MKPAEKTVITRSPPFKDLLEQLFLLSEPHFRVVAEERLSFFQKFFDLEEQPANNRDGCSPIRR